MYYKQQNWYLIDGKGQTLGGLATIITSLLKGKNKPQYYPALSAILTGLVCFVSFKLIPLDLAAPAAILLSLLSYILIKSLLHDVISQPSN